MDNWKWDNVCNYDIHPEDCSDIYYLVMFVPVYHVNSVWGKIQYLTAASQLGYRSAVSPTAMTEGKHPDHHTIILDMPPHLKLKAFQVLEETGLLNYVRSWRQRPRYGEKTYGTGAIILEEYY